MLNIKLVGGPQAGEEHKAPRDFKPIRRQRRHLYKNENGNIEEETVVSIYRWDERTRKYHYCPDETRHLKTLKNGTTVLAGVGA